MDISIIIVSWNVREKLRENLKTLFASQGDFEFEVFVVDNNSGDASAEMVKKDFPQVELITNTENLGFAKANNQAIKKAAGDFILLLNPDMLLKPDTLKTMLDWTRANKQASVAGCHLIDRRNNTIKHVRRFPRVCDQLAIILKLPHLFPWILKNYLRFDFDYSRPSKVDSIRGGFFIIRREIINKLGGLDERYFLWFEEVDFCRQVHENGGEVWYAPAAECVDYVGQSFKQVGRGQAQKYMRDSQLAYFKKWHPAWQYLVLKIAWMLIWPLVLSGDKLKLNHQAET